MGWRNALHAHTDEHKKKLASMLREYRGYAVVLEAAGAERAHKNVNRLASSIEAMIYEIDDVRAEIERISDAIAGYGGKG